jgi:hypothetical protein
VCLSTIKEEQLMPATEDDLLDEEEFDGGEEDEDDPDWEEEDEDDPDWEDHHVPIGRKEMEDIDREYAEKEQAVREQRAREGHLLRARGLRRTALGIGVASRLAARLQVKLERVEHRILDPLARQEVREHLTHVREAASALERIRRVAETEARISDHTLADGRIVRR